MPINHILLKKYYLDNKEQYIHRRKSGDIKLWDESYKWDIFPEINEKFKKIEEVNAENITEIIETLVKNNPSQGSFAHWIDMDDLKLLMAKPNGYQIISKVWHKSPEYVDKYIDTANYMAEFMLNKKFSPSTFGYILAAQDCGTYAIYLDKLIRKVARLNEVEKPGTLSQGAKYKLLDESANYIGELMQMEKEDYQDFPWHTALNGQDFIYVNMQYPALELVGDDV
ncbi:hypothetical protein KA025_00730 [Candidatus Saccharibacteria bacterium]|jgi:hypothetical protein|nr:hypothetical protein [Candidatus Saccharibacteria bacterium]MBP7834591.1 hypothetical protein [Candidatus Saccharibacteria bacterium]